MLIFTESKLHARTAEKGKVVTGIHDAVSGCYKNAGEGF